MLVTKTVQSPGKRGYACARRTANARLRSAASDGSAIDCSLVNRSIEKIGAQTKNFQKLKSRRRTTAMCDTCDQCDCLIFCGRGMGCKDGNDCECDCVASEAS